MIIIEKKFLNPTGLSHFYDKIDAKYVDGDVFTSAIDVINDELINKVNDEDIASLSNQEIDEIVETSQISDYDSTKTYSVGDFCFYNEILYCCITDISFPEAWNSNHWEEATESSTLVELIDLVQDANAEISDLKDDLNDLQEEIEGMPIPRQETVSVQLYDNKFIFADSNQSSYGQAYSGSGWKYSGYISCEKYSSIDITMPKTVNRSDAGIVFYSDNVSANVPGSCIVGYFCNYGASGGTEREVRRFEIPEGAKYFRTTYGSSISNFECVGYWSEASGGIPAIFDSINELHEEVDDLAESINEVSAESVAEDAHLLDIIETATGLSDVIRIKVEGKYLKTTNNVIDVNNPLDSGSGYGYVIVPCTEGDIFNVSGVSSNSYPMAWAFTDSSYAILSKADSNITVTNAIVTAPENASYLVIHDKTPYRTSYKGTPIKDDIEAIASDVESVRVELRDRSKTVEVPLSNNGFINADSNQPGLYGKVYSANGWKYSGYIACEGYESITITMPKLQNQSDAGIVFYTDNISSNVPVSCIIGYRCNGGSSGGTEREVRHFEVPSGAKYFRTTYTVSISDYFECTGHWTSEYGVNDICKDIESVKKDVEEISVSAHKKYYETIGQKKAKQLTMLQWTPKAQVPKQYGTSYFPANAVRSGMLYSDAYAINKVVNYDVSMRTFMTALNNPYSLIYTENINPEHSNSAYGVTYEHGDHNSAAYFGMACNSFVMHCLGSEIPYSSYYIGGKGVEKGLFEKVFDQSANGLELLDILQINGHVRIVTDIVRDKDGFATSVTYSECVGTGATTVTLTADEFNNIILGTQGYTIYRYKDVYKNIHYSPSEFVRIDDEPAISYTYNNDICTFAGDYASFKEGDLIYINYTKGSYSQMEIYKNDTLIDTITLDSSSDTHSVNLTTKNFTYGKYKARLKNGSTYSDYTYFEIINITASLSGNTLSFSSANGDPLFWTWIKSGNYYTYSPTAFTAAEISSGEADVSESDPQYTKLKVVVQGDYGRVMVVL